MPPPGPFALSQPGALEALVREAGLVPSARRVVESPWHYPDLETALRGLLSAGPARRAVENSSEEAAGEAATRAIAPYRRPDGGYTMRNRFHYLVAAPR